MDVNGVEYPIRAINQVKKGGKKYTLIETKYYTRNFNVNPGEEEVPRTDLIDKRYPFEDDLIRERDEKRARRQSTVKWRCPYCEYEFNTEYNCKRHMNGVRETNESPARPSTCAIRKNREETTNPSDKKPIKIIL